MATQMKGQIAIAAKPLATIAPNQVQAATAIAPKHLLPMNNLVPAAPSSAASNPAKLNGNSIQSQNGKATSKASKTSTKAVNQQQQQAKPITNGTQANKNAPFLLPGQANQQQNPAKPPHQNGVTSPTTTQNNGTPQTQQQQQQYFQFVPIKPSPMSLPMHMPMQMQLQTSANGTQFIVPVSMPVPPGSQAHINQQQNQQPNGTNTSANNKANSSSDQQQQHLQHQHLQQQQHQQQHQLMQQQFQQNFMHLFQKAQHPYQQNPNQHPNQPIVLQNSFQNPNQQQLNNLIQGHGQQANGNNLNQQNQQQQQQIFLNQASFMQALQAMQQPNQALAPKPGTIPANNSMMPNKINGDDSSKNSSVDSKTLSAKKSSPAMKIESTLPNVKKATETNGGEEGSTDADMMDCSASMNGTMSSKKRGRPRLYEVNPTTGKSIKGKLLNGNGNGNEAPQQQQQQKQQQQQQQQPQFPLFNSNLPSHLFPAQQTGIYPSPSPTTSVTSSSSSSSSTTNSVNVNPTHAFKNVKKSPDTQQTAKPLRPIKSKQDMLKEDFLKANTNSAINNHFEQPRAELSCDSEENEENNINNNNNSNNNNSSMRKNMSNNSNIANIANNHNSSGGCGGVKRSSMEMAASSSQQKENKEVKAKNLSPQSMKSKQVVLTHIIDGYVIKESSKPFPVKPTTNNATNGKDEEAMGRSNEEQDDEPLSSTPKKMAMSCEAATSSKHQLHISSHDLKIGNDQQQLDCSMNSTRSKSHKCSKSHHKHHKHHHHKHRSSSSKLNDSSMNRSTNDTSMRDASNAHNGKESSSSKSKKSSKAHSSPEKLKKKLKKSEQMTPSSGSAEMPGGNPTDWNCEQVFQFINNVAGMQTAEMFRSQEVDGSALALIRDDHLVNTMQIKLGPALKIMSKFNELKERFNSSIKFIK